MRQKVCSGRGAFETTISITVTILIRYIKSIVLCRVHLTERGIKEDQNTAFLEIK